MKVSTLKRSIMLCRDAGITPMIWGHRGIGKSSVVQQTCFDHKLGMIDLRASQIEASDIRGLPDKQNGRTVYLPPADMPIGGMPWKDLEVELGFDPALIYEKVDELKAKGNLPEATRLKEIFVRSQPRLDSGILFLDELNRGQDDVLQAAFQLVLDHKVGLYSLPPGWCVVSAGNFMEGYLTNGFTDPAFLNRFCHLILSSDDMTLPEWVDYISEKHGEPASGVIEFASQNISHLHGDLKSELGFSIQPSPRSWEAAIRVEKVVKVKEYGDDARLAVLAGLVGKELSIAYVNYSCPVKPMDIITNGVDANKAKLRGLSRQQVMGLVWGLSGFLKKKIEDDHYGKVALDFTRWLCKEHNEKDIAVAFCNIMVSGGSGPQRIKSAMISNPNVSALISRYSDGGKSFAHRLSQDPDLREVVSRVAWYGK